MPSQRCPDCGRFLPRGFVASLAEQSAPCPRCGVELDGTRLVTDPSAPPDPSATPGPPDLPAASGPPAAPGPPDLPAASGPPAADVAGSTEPVSTWADEVGPAADAGGAVGPHDASVRPPDLAPDTVRDDVLAGWDVGVGPADMARWREDHRPFPTDTMVVAGAAASGLVLGAMLDDRPARGAAVGTVVGAVAGAAARRIWRLEP